MTRVFAFKMSRDVSNRVYPETGVNTGFHIASHHGEREDRILDFAKINSYHVSLVPYFLEKLKETPDGDGNLLDNSLIIYGSPMGNSNVHNHKRCPLFIAGHAGGALKGNLHIKARRRHADGQRDADGAARRRRRAGRVRRQHGRDGSRTRRPRPRSRSERILSRVMRQHSLSVRFARSRLADGRRRCRSALLHGAGLGAPVADAAMAKDAAAVRQLLKEGADVNAAQGDGMTALHWAALTATPSWPRCCSYAGANVARDDAPRRLHAAAPRQPGGHAARDRAAGRSAARRSTRAPPPARRR